MQPARRAAAALRREERGFTLIEMLVATLAGLVVLGGALTVFMGGIRSEPRTASQTAAIQQARTTVDRITRELRQGLETPTTAKNQLAIVTYVKAATCGGPAASTAIPCRVTYTCTAGFCTRVVAKPDGTGSGSPTTVATGLTGSEVFEYLPDEENPTYIGVTFSFDAGDGAPVTLGDGVALRNLEGEA